MPAPLAPSVTDAQFYAALRAFLLLVTGNAQEVIRTQVNRVALPVGPNWISMTSDARSRIEKTVDQWDYSAVAPTTLDIIQNTKIEVQLDLYGPTGPDTSAVIAAVFNDSYACDYFAATNLPIAPLYATDGHQMPLINGEEQYEQRWTMTLALQVNLTVSTPQDFADTLTVGLINVDVVYPPEP